MTKERSTGLRTDIEGLRALAIGLVLVYHASTKLLPGGFIGVDIFFVISGFLITGLLVREAEATGKVSLSRFYARRAKRLLPVSAIVLVAAAIVTVTLLPISQRKVFGFDIVGAALYVVNWVFAGRAVDYAAQDAGASPVLHYWSLAVEEQFYIVWPLILLVVVALTKHKSRLVRPAMAVGLAVVVIPSLAWSAILANRQDPSDFFVTTTRLWELGIGGLLAIAVPLLTRIPRALANAIALAGAAAVAFAAITFHDTLPWPGLWALVPVLGTAAMIGGGVAAAKGPVGTVLSWRPLVWIGGLSYSLYLWHWVVLLAGREGFGLTGAKWGLVLVTAALIPAWIGHKLVENPVRFSAALSKNSGMALAVGAAATLVGVVAGLLVAVSAPRPTVTNSDATFGEQPLGAMALGAVPSESALGWAQDSYDVLWPDPSAVSADTPSYVSKDCFTQPTEADLKPCDFGDLDSAVHVLAVGDSKLAQYYDALDFVGKANGWHLTMYAKGSCPFSAATRFRDGEVWKVCTEWNDALLAEILAVAPDAVITTQGANTGILPQNGAAGAESREDGVAGLVEVWSALQSADVPVFALLDNPRAPTGYDPYTCLVDNADNATACAFERVRGIENSGAPAQVAAAALVEGATVVDLTDYLCPQQVCAPVIGNVIVYRDGTHITNTYAKSLGPVLAQRLAAAGAASNVAVPAVPAVP